MANELEMAIVEAILQLRALHWSARRIARELHLDRGTVRKYLKQAERAAKPAISPAGSQGELDGLPEASPGAAVPAPVADPPGQVRRGRPSECAPYRAIVLEKLEQGLSAQRIYQDLLSEHGFTGSYDSVKRFVRPLGRSRALPMRRMECAAGEEAQVDFGSGAAVLGTEGKCRKTHVFRVVLSHSRKAYSEATFRQTTEDFIGCLENAFWQFGGCPKVLVIDNLRAAVKHPDWFDPELVPKLRSFCQHYGIAILPTRPYMPRHKGKVESGVKYVQNNALKARKFSSLQEQNEHLTHWESTVADTRIHGTTRQQVGRVFREVERAALQPLPRERFPWFQEAPRKVSRDGHVEVARAYYSVPPEYLGHTVWVRWDARLVRIFNQRFEQIAVHVRHEQGRFSTHAQHLAPEKISGIEGTRVPQGVLSLTRRHPSEALENACQTALAYGAFHLRTLRQLIGRQAAQQTMLPFLDEHPIIRPLADYAGVVAAALARKAASGGRGARHDWAKAAPAGLSSNGPEGTVVPQGPAELLPPRSGYPLSGCSPAGPDSVSPDPSSVVATSVSECARIRTILDGPVRWRGVEEYPIPFNWRSYGSFGKYAEAA